MSRALIAEGTANPNYRWTVLAVSVGAQATFLGAVFQGLPVLGPALRSAYGLSLGQLGLVLSSVAVGILATLLAWGAAADRFGERRVMVLGLLGSAVALLVAARASDLSGLVAALLAAGACGASVNAAGGRAVMGWFAFTERGLAMGIRQTALPLGAAAAAMSLPVLAAVGGVDGALLALAACCALAAASVAIWVREPPMAGTGRTAEVADKGPARNPEVWRVAAAGALLAIPQFGVVAFLVVFLHEERGYALGTAAGFLAAVQLLGGAARILVGRWSDLRGSRVGLLRKLGLATALGLLITSALIWAPDPVLLPTLLATSVLAASWNGLANTAVAELAAPGRSGTAIGLYSTVMGVGASAAPPAFAGVVTATSSWVAGFAAVAAGPLLAVTVLAPIARREGPPRLADHVEYRGVKGVAGRWDTPR